LAALSATVCVAWIAHMNFGEEDGPPILAVAIAAFVAALAVLWLICSPKDHRPSGRTR
jgi:hypothetical protein